MSTTSSVKTNNGAFDKKKWLIDDDDTGYLSQETKNRRADQKLINNITATLYRLELDNIKPSFDVKLRTGLHRGPTKPRRTRRSQRDTSTTPAEFERSRSRAPSYAPSNIDERVRDIEYRARHPEYDDDFVPMVASMSWRGSDESWTPAIENYRRRRFDDPYYQATVDRYATLPRRWLRQLELMEEADRRQAAVTAATRPPSRRAGASDEYNELVSYLQEPASAAASSSPAGQRFFDVDDKDDAAFEDGNGELELLLDGPFARGNTQGSQPDVRIWRTRGEDKPIEYISARY